MSRPVWGSAHVLAAGALPLRRSCCGLRRSAPDGTSAGRSIEFDVVAFDASCGRARVCARARRSCCCHCCAADGEDHNLYRVGASEGPTFASRVPPPAPLLPPRLTSNAWNVCISATNGGRTTFFDRIERATTSLPRELPHILLTALARFARWSGVDARGLDALVRNGASTVHCSPSPPRPSTARSRGARRRYRPKCKICLTSFSPRPPAHCIP